jgi:aspartyl protease family protein
MLKNALAFAVAALIIGLSAPEFFADHFGAAPPPGAAVATVAGAANAGKREATIAADRFGQFRADATVEGQPVEMLVDTGASTVAIAAETAARIGVAVDPAAPKKPVQTAAGLVLVTPITLRQVSVGDVSLDDVEAVVLPPGAGGVDLIGASFLKRLASVEQRDGALALRQ